MLVISGESAASGATGGTGPAGPTGPTGAAGATGPAGAAGVAGATGATGAAGTNGTNGATGATGAAGADNTAAIKTGANIVDADVTLLLSNGSRFIKTVVSTAIRNVTLSVTGAAVFRGFVIERQEASAFTMTITNGGPLAGVVFTFPASTKMMQTFVYNGADYVPGLALELA